MLLKSGGQLAFRASMACSPLPFTSPQSNCSGLRATVLAKSRSFIRPMKTALPLPAKLLHSVFGRALKILATRAICSVFLPGTICLASEQSTKIAKALPRPPGFAWICGTCGRKRARIGNLPCNPTIRLRTTRNWRRNCAACLSRL